MRLKDMILEERVKELERIVKILEARILNLEQPYKVYGPQLDPNYWVGVDQKFWEVKGKDG
jgi:hypothetical protein